MRSSLVAVIAAAAGCVTFEDRCVDVRCGVGEICVDREPAPTCVCDSEHEADESGACVPVEPAAEVDAGPEN